MGAGIKVYNVGGSLSFDISSRLFRLLDRINYSNANGSASFSRINPEDTDLVAVPRSWYAPVFTINVANSTVSWDFSAIQPQYRYGGTVEIWAR